MVEERDYTQIGSDELIITDKAQSVSYTKTPVSARGPANSANAF